MSWLLGAVWLFSGALLLPSCETTDPGAGSNTNWLRSCESDGECGEGLSCTCGVCSRVCEDDCSLLPDAECAPLGSARLRTQCGDAEAPSGLCLPVCVDSASCAPGQLCVDGGCVALLSDGAAWSTSALALALAASQRTVQRALVELEHEGRVRSIGQARARRWLSPPLVGFTTSLLLPTALPLQ